MVKALRFRFGIMLLLIFLAFFFDAMNGEFIWDMQSGICNEYDFGNRKCLTGIFEWLKITDEKQIVNTIRAIDKMDRLGNEGVKSLLGKGRKDESGDFTKELD